MAICSQCKKCGECGKPYSLNSNYAERCKDFEEKKITNIEKIKNMGVDEMAEFLHNSFGISPSSVCNAVCNGFCYARYKPECMKKIKNWLESEVK